MAFVEVVLADGVWENSTTTGTSTFTLSGALAGYRAFSVVPSGKKTFYCIRDATNFEIGIGTPSGSSLTREQVITSTNNNGLVNFTAGTKDVFCDLAFNLVALTYRTNVFSADQDFNGNRIILDPGGGSDIRAATDNIVDFYASSVPRARIDGPNAIFKIYRQDETATEGPEFRLYRQSSTAASADNLGVIRWTGHNTSGSEVTYAKIRADILTTTAGAEDGRLAFMVQSDGSIQEVFHIRQDTMIMSADTEVFGSGKTATAPNTLGWEFNSSGGGLFTTDNSTPLILNRKTADGTIIDVRRDNANVATVSVASGVVTWGTFTGHHWSQWAPDTTPVEDIGTVLCADGGLLEGFAHLPLVRPSMRARERSVYGVLAGKNEDGRLIVNSIGTYRVRVIGPVVNGALLESSDTPGVAQPQADDVIRSSTIGKATQDHDGSGLVPCVLYCG